MVEHYIESYLIHEFSSSFCMILVQGQFATRPHPCPALCMDYLSVLYQILQ
jgi:hypothetical protein